MAAVLAGLLAVPPGVVKAQAGLIHEEESRYQFIQVVQAGEERRLYLNEGYAIHSVWRPDTVLTGGEWDMFLTAPPLLGRPARRVAMLGNAGGTTARAYGVLLPGRRASTASSSTPPSAPSAGAGSASATTRASPCTRPTRARSSRATDTRYDLILIDAYRQPYVPFYLATREFFRLCRQRLAPGGVVALNVSTVPGDDRLARAVAGTLRAEFPQVVTWQALRFNQFVVGLTHAAPAGGHGRPPERGAPRPPPLTQPLRPRPARGVPGRRSLDGRPRPRGVDHRPDDRRPTLSAAPRRRSTSCPRRPTDRRGRLPRRPVRGLAAPPHGNYPGTCSRGHAGCASQLSEEARMEDKPQFRVDYEATTDDVGVVILEGEIDIYSAPEFKEVLVNGIEGGAKRVIVDLSGVTFIDSTALGVLVSGAKRVRPRNGNLDIVCTDENIIRIFEITGLDRIFGIFPSRGEALKAASA